MENWILYWIINCLTLKSDPISFGSNCEAGITQPRIQSSNVRLFWITHFVLSWILYQYLGMDPISYQLQVYF